MKPRSPVSRSTRGSASASSQSALTNAVPHAAAPCRARARARPARLRTARRSSAGSATDLRSMYETPLPKTVCASSTCGVPPPASSVVDRRRDRRASWPSTLVRRPSRRPPALVERREVDHVARVAERLLAVDVDDRDEAREPVVGGEHDRLPDRALVALGIAHQHERAPRRCPRGGRRAPSPRPSESPWPSEPVEKSTPGSTCSGCVAEPAAVAAVARELVGVDHARSRATRRTAPGSRGPSRARSGRVRDRPGRRPAARPRRACRGCRRPTGSSRCARRSHASTARSRCGGSGR